MPSVPRYRAPSPVKEVRYRVLQNVTSSLFRFVPHCLFHSSHVFSRLSHSAAAAPSDNSFGHEMHDEELSRQVCGPDTRRGAHHIVSSCH